MMATKHLKIALIVLCSASAIILVISLKVNPFLFNQNNIGSFEYIRTGEGLADKGRYAEAVGYFEKAFEASPESDIIKANLAWIYTVYAKELSSSDNPDRAVYFFNKAHELKRNSATAQNLAMAYIRRAVVDLRRGEWSKGIESCTTARELVSDSRRASENIGVYLYNEAQKEMKAGRDTIAVLLLSESFLASESKYPFDLLGDIYYQRNDLEQAAFYWGKALEMDPDNAALAEKTGRIAKEMDLARTQQKSDMGRFELHYDSKLKFDVQQVEEALKKAYLKAGKRLAYLPEGKTAVFLYSEDDFRKLFNLSAHVRAFYDGSIRMPMPQGALAGDELRQFIEHEYAHAVLSALTENNCPSWLGEGVAVSMQVDGEIPRIKDVILKMRAASKLSLAYLETAFKGDDPDLGDYYLIAYTVVQYITDTFGYEGLRGILKRMKSGQHFVNAMDDQLLMSEGEFERRWLEYVERKFLTEKK